MFVVILFEPTKRRTVYGPFATANEARAYAQGLNDNYKEEGSGYKVAWHEVNLPRQ